MAIALNRFVRALLVFALLVPAIGRAEVLVDPTRPSGAGALGSGGENGSATQSNELMVVRSIVLKPDRKPRALINDKWVEQGQIYAGSRVLKITKVGVILQQRESTGAVSSLLLRLNPEVEKQEPVPVGLKRSVEIK